MCLSDTDYTEDLDRIPREPTQPIPTGNNPGAESESDACESRAAEWESSSRCSEEEEHNADRPEDDNDHVNQPGDCGGNEDGTYLPDADQVIFGKGPRLKGTMGIQTRDSKDLHKE